MLIFSLGVAFGFLINPAMRAYYNYDFYKNAMKYGFKRSVSLSFNDIWS